GRGLQAFRRRIGPADGRGADAKIVPTGIAEGAGDIRSQVAHGPDPAGFLKSGGGPPAAKHALDRPPHVVAVVASLAGPRAARLDDQINEFHTHRLPGALFPPGFLAATE